MTNKRKMTITEAMAELKLIDKKLQKKKEFIISNVTTSDIQPDVLNGQGKSKIKAEMQSCEDLQEQYTNIKKAISIANNQTTVTISNKTMTIQEWLNWKCYTYDFEVGMLNRLINELSKNREPRAYKDEEGNPKFEVITFNIQVEDVKNKFENIMDIYERLDGQLSLKNATTIIEF